MRDLGAQALQSAAAAAAEMSSQHQAHGGYEHVPPVSIGQELHHHNGGVCPFQA